MTGLKDLSNDELAARLQPLLEEQKRRVDEREKTRKWGQLQGMVTRNFTSLDAATQAEIRAENLGRPDWFFDQGEWYRRDVGYKGGL
jgi:hypothetical protein